MTVALLVALIVLAIGSVLWATHSYGKGYEEGKRKGVKIGHEQAYVELIAGMVNAVRESFSQDNEFRQGFLRLASRPIQDIKLRYWALLDYARLHGYAFSYKDGRIVVIWEIGEGGD